MEQIRKYFQQSIELPEEDWAFFSSKLVRQELPKKHLLLKVGQVENYLYYVEKGILRFYIPKEESDLTFDFAFENNFTSGYSSFLTKTPSPFQIETLTAHTVLWRVSYDDLQSIYQNTTVGNKIGRMASEELFLRKTKRELSLLNETAEQRYLNLFSQQPELIKHIPLKHIASFIGITPQALSRIRRRIS